MADQGRNKSGGLETTDGPDEAEHDHGLLAATRRAIDPILTVWMAIVRAFSWVVARLVAVVLFVVGFIPYSIVMRLVQFDPLDRRLDTDAKSYWKEAEAKNDDVDAFRKQY